jgi:nucleotidyltransferase/DNA polymerase involved in DNA repair
LSGEHFKRNKKLLESTEIKKINEGAKKGDKRFFKEKFNEKIKTQSAQNQTNEDIGITKEGEGNGEMQKPEKNNPGEIGHVRVAGDGT